MSTILHYISLCCKLLNKGRRLGGGQKSSKYYQRSLWMPHWVSDMWPIEFEYYVVMPISVLPFSKWFSCFYSQCNRNKLKRSTHTVLFIKIYSCTFAVLQCNSFYWLMAIQYMVSHNEMSFSNDRKKNRNLHNKTKQNKVALLSKHSTISFYSN